MRTSRSGRPTGAGLAASRSPAADPGRGYGGEWDWAKNAARIYPHRTFIETARGAWTFQAWSLRVDRVAGALRAAGLKPGDRLAVLHHGGLESAALVFSSIRAGLVLVPVNIRLGPGEVGHILKDARPRLVIVAESLQDRLSALPPGLPTWVVGDGDADLLGEPVPLGWTPGPEQVQSLIYTSGTTGTPKGAVLTLSQHWWNAIGSLLRLGHDPADCWLLCMPLFHVGGQAILFRAAIGGSRVILEPRFQPASVASWLRSGDVSLVSLVPTMLERVLDEHPGPFSPRLRAVLLGGAATPPALLERGMAAGLPLVPTYGMTETASQMATVDPTEHEPYAGARPLFAADIAIGDPDAEGVGEILVRGPQVSPGYWVDGMTREETGWLRTGDVGRLDQSGRLTVYDRRRDLIVSGGENVYPAEVEAALLQDSRVRRAAVVPVRDNTWGQVPAAAVVLAEGARATPDELADGLSERLARYKIPRHWRMVDSLPETANGKILRREVQDWFQSEPQ